MDKAILREVKALGSDIIASERFAKARLVPHHSKDGNKLDENGNRTDEVEFAAKNDRGYEWWLNEGKLIVEDPAYCASVADTMGDWIDLIIGMK